MVKFLVKKLVRKEKENRKEKNIRLFFFEIGWQTEISDEMLTEVNYIFSNLHISEASIAQKVVIAVGNGVFSARFPEKNG